MLNKIKFFLPNALSRLGIIGTSLFLWQKLLDIIPIQVTDRKYKTGKINLKQLQYPLIFRYSSSDLLVLSQIFIYGEYEPIIDTKNIKFILDCGANVGYSTIYFLSIFPNAHVVAVEPDLQNLELLRQNLAPYSDRVTILSSAIWSHSTNLKLENGGHTGDRSEWAVTVRECEPFEKTDIKAQDIDSILNDLNWNKIDILKIDIEGAEIAVFGNNHNFKNWIQKVETLVIELHGKECEDVFFQAVESEDFKFSRSGELTIAKRKEKSLA
jgi:FkbM family methyltransferase